MYAIVQARGRQLKVTPGAVVEIDGVTEPVAREALRLGAAKLPIKTRVVARVEG